MKNLVPVTRLVHSVAWFDAEMTPQVIENVEHLDAWGAIGHLKTTPYRNREAAKQCRRLLEAATTRLC